MIVIGVDPGTTQSAYVRFNGASVLAHGILGNDDFLVALRESARTDVMALEAMESSYGMAVGKEVLRTVFDSGRFTEAFFPGRVELLFRRVIKLHLCHTARSTDANIRQALLDRFGPQGVKAQPGLLYGLRGHEFAALAAAVTFYDQHGHDTGDIVRPGVLEEF